MTRAEGPLKILDVKVDFALGARRFQSTFRCEQIWEVWELFELDAEGEPHRYSGDWRADAVLAPAIQRLLDMVTWR